jgi:hypothetical protein
MSRVDALVFAVMDPEAVEEGWHARVFCEKRVFIVFQATAAIHG